jgi:hypothetical protein
VIHQLAFEIYNSTALKDEFSDEGSRCESYNELAESTINKVNVIRGLSVLVAGTSIFSLVIIILTIDAEEKLRAHPAKLIRMICLVESIFVWHALIQSPRISAGYFACYFGIPKMFLSATTFST